jgi:hypothetical protein
MLLALLMACAAYDKLVELTEDPPVPPCDARTTWWEDADGDGAGNPADAWVSCDAHDGWVDVAGDCDDTDPTVTTGCADTGDTAAPPDTGDTAAPPDTGDTAAPADTADTADTADSPDTAAVP